LIAKELRRPIKMREGQKTVEIPAIQVVFRRLIIDAMKGNLAAVNSLTAIMHDVTRFHTCVERASGSSDRLIGVRQLGVQRV